MVKKKNKSDDESDAAPGQLASEFVYSDSEFVSKISRLHPTEEEARAILKQIETEAIQYVKNEIEKSGSVSVAEIAEEVRRLKSEALNDETPFGGSFG